MEARRSFWSTFNAWCWSTVHNSWTHRFSWSFWGIRMNWTQKHAWLIRMGRRTFRKRLRWSRSLIGIRWPEHTNPKCQSCRRWPRVDNCWAPLALISLTTQSQIITSNSYCWSQPWIQWVRKATFRWKLRLRTKAHQKYQAKMVVKRARAEIRLLSNLRTRLTMRPWKT